MNQQLATLRVAGSLERSTEVMKSMQNLVKVEEISQIMQDMSKEMMRAGIIDEMLEETLEGTLGDGEELEEQAEEEVDKVLFEITDGQLGKAPEVVADSLPSVGKKEKVKPAAATAATTSDTDEIDEMRERLQALRN